MSIPRGYIEELINRNDIVDVIGSYTKLKRVGKRFTALCPFHNDKNASFIVYPDTKSFYCFGCGASGDVISFIMKSEKITYIEAVKRLACRAGMDLPDISDDPGMILRTRILEANKAAMQFYIRSLNSDKGKKAKEYLKRRGIKDSTVSAFGIGYAPDYWTDLKDHLISKGFNEDEIIAAGLCKRSQKGYVFDFFRDRIMFPVIDAAGNVLAFSGRRLNDDGDPRKYVNTQNTPVFNKTGVLFAMNMAKKSVADSGELILVEGQMDAISLHQAGFQNAVATLGTALTEDHIRLMSNYADTVVIAYDSDDSGIKAAERAIALFRNTSLSVRLLSVTGAKDADEYINKYGSEMFKKLIEDSVSSVEYELKKACSNNDISTLFGKVQFMRQAANIIAKCNSPAEREIYADWLAERTGVSKTAIIQEIQIALDGKKQI